MRAKFIEGPDLELGLSFEPESDDERLLMRAFSAQCSRHGGLLRILGWGMGGENPGIRHIRIYSVKPDKEPPT